jgi:glycosyltransferase involved in cell wall biosynthesis
MEVIFVDNGLIGKGEHSYSLIKLVGERLTFCGVRYRAFGMKSIDPVIVAEIGALPHFSRSLYESESPTPNERCLLTLFALARGRAFDATIPSERTSARVLNAAYEQDLAALPPDVWSSEKLIVAPAVSQNQIVGLVRNLRAKPNGERLRVVCQLMFAPNWTPWGRTGKLGQRLYGEAFSLAGPMIGKTLFFTTENEAIAGLYRDQYGIETSILPVPFGDTMPAAPCSDRPTFGFFGYSKCDKGFHLLPRAIEICRAHGVDANFSIQIQHGGWEPATVATERALRQIPCVRFVEGILSHEEYKVETGKIDAMLLPYDPVLFGLRGSGIFTQSVSAGRPVIASAGTFAGTSIANGKAEGEIFSPQDSAALAAAIMRLRGRLADSHARAAKLSRAFAHKHSAEAYVDALLAHAAR